MDKQVTKKQLEEACALILQYKLGSTSLLQRKMKLGYRMASAIMLKLEQLKIVSEFGGGKPRKVLKNEIEINEIIKQL